MSTQTVSKIKIELPFFDINVSEEDILTKTSCFNPYPEKAAEGGLMVWTISHPMTNPGGWIKYPSTGEVYYVLTPLSYPSEAEINPPRLDTTPLDYGDGNGRWITLTEYVSYLSRGFVRGAQHDGADLSKVDAVLKSDEVAGLPPRQKFIELVRLAARLLDEGDFYTASIAIEYGSHGGSYYDIFDYHCKQLAFDVCPSLPSDDIEAYRRAMSGYHTEISDVASNIDALLQTTINLVALRMMMANGTAVAQSYIKGVLEFEKALHTRVTTELLLKKNKVTGQSYLDMLHAYFLGTGIEL